MTSDDPCPKCGAEISLVDPTEEVWSLRHDEYEEDAEVWLCIDCGWHQEATLDESMEEASANIDWIMSRLADA